MKMKTNKKRSTCQNVGKKRLIFIYEKNYRLSARKPLVTYSDKIEGYKTALLFEQEENLQGASLVSLPSSHVAIEHRTSG